MPFSCRGTARACGPGRLIGNTRRRVGSSRRRGSFLGTDCNASRSQGNSRLPTTARPRRRGRLEPPPHCLPPGQMTGSPPGTAPASFAEDPGDTARRPGGATRPMTPRFRGRRHTPGDQPDGRGHVAGPVVVIEVLLLDEEEGASLRAPIGIPACGQAFEYRWNAGTSGLARAIHFSGPCRQASLRPATGRPGSADACRGHHKAAR